MYVTEGVVIPGRNREVSYTEQEGKPERLVQINRDPYGAILCSIRSILLSTVNMPVSHDIRHRSCERRRGSAVLWGPSGAGTDRQTSCREDAVDVPSRMTMSWLLFARLQTTGSRTPLTPSCQHVAMLYSLGDSPAIHALRIRNLKIGCFSLLGK